jgi:hypothetical protein
MFDHPSKSPEAARHGICDIQLTCDALGRDGNAAFRLATKLSEAEDVIAEWGAEASARKIPVPTAVGFEIHFTNGETFRGRFAMDECGLDSGNRLFREAVVEHLKYGAGRARPVGMLPEDYMARLQALGGNLVRGCAKILDECEFEELWG